MVYWTIDVPEITLFAMGGMVADGGRWLSCDDACEYALRRSGPAINDTQ